MKIGALAMKAGCEAQTVSSTPAVRIERVQSTHLSP